MKSLSYILIIFLLILLELFLAPHLRIADLGPNFILVAILVWFTLSNVKEAMKWLIPSGLILDFFSPLPFGVISLSLLITLFLIFLVSARLFGEKNLNAIILITIIGTLVYQLSLLLLVMLFSFVKLSSLKIDFTYHLTHSILSSELYNLVVMYIIYKLLKHYRNWLKKNNVSF